MPKRSEVGLADLITAFAVLQPKDDEAAAGIAKVLGYERRPDPAKTGETKPGETGDGEKE